MKSKLEIVINQKDKKRIIYKVVEEQGNRCILSGINYRVKLDVEKKYLEEASIDLIKKEEKEKDKYYLHTKFRRGNKKNLLGTVLHIDTDEEYLNKCVDLYESIGIYVYPMLCDEKDISYNIRNKELDFIPDVIVITGHDYFYGHNKKDIEDYMNTKYYAKAVLDARKKYPNSVIIAGACQSLFEALVARGANFASSPSRKNIHVYDPALIAINVCTTSQKQIVDFCKAGKHIEDFESAFGGVETYGKMKMLY